jgi:hypothetical protein
MFLNTFHLLLIIKFCYLKCSRFCIITFIPRGFHVLFQPIFNYTFNDGVDWNIICTKKFANIGILD